MGIFNKSATTIIAISAGIIIVLASVSFATYRYLNRNTASQAESAVENIANINNYPEKYREDGLPVYPNAEVTYIGDAVAGPKEGVFIYINSDDSLEQISNFFDIELKNLGWQLPEERSTESSGIITRTYLKDNQTFALILVRDDEIGQSNATINWQQQ